MDRTLFIVKPDGVARGLVGEIVARLERKQLRLVAAELRTIDSSTAARHYAEHEGKDYYDKLVEFITGGPRSSRSWRVPRTRGRSFAP